MVNTTLTAACSLATIALGMSGRGSHLGDRIRTAERITELLLKSIGRVQKMKRLEFVLAASIFASFG